MIALCYRTLRTIENSRFETFDPCQHHIFCNFDIREVYACLIDSYAILLIVRSFR